MFGFLSDFLFGMIGVSTGALNTKKIDSNIELLKQQEWFKKVYTDEKYHRLFITNRQIRAYLQSRTRIKKILQSEKAQRKLMLLVDKQIES